MKQYLKIIKRLLSECGLRPVRFFLSFLEFPRFIKDAKEYTNLNKTNKFNILNKELNPILWDRKASAGAMKGHYVHQDLWAARKIHAENPKRHVDVGSRVDGFVTKLLVFRDVEVVDIRPLNSPYSELKFIQDDATMMSKFKDKELESVSCLHAMEHFGLGRYGDPINPQAIELFAQSLSRVIKTNGKLYLSVPIGRERVEFNAHRVFNPQTILDLYEDFDLVSFSAVNDNGEFLEAAEATNFKTAEFSCGLFEFKKKK